MLAIKHAINTIVIHIMVIYWQYVNEKHNYIIHALGKRISKSLRLTQRVVCYLQQV